MTYTFVCKFGFEPLLDYRYAIPDPSSYMTPEQLAALDLLSYPGQLAIVRTQQHCYREGVTTGRHYFAADPSELIRRSVAACIPCDVPVMELACLQQVDSLEESREAARQARELLSTLTGKPCTMPLVELWPDVEYS